MLVDIEGHTTGVLSGGCLEEKIAHQAREIIAGAPPKLIHFDTRQLYGCDGHVSILIERLPAAGTEGNTLTRLGDVLERREPARLRTCYEGSDAGTCLLGPTDLVVERQGVLIHQVPLPVRLLLFGTGPEIAPLRQLALVLGWVVEHFPRVTDLPEKLRIDSQTAALVMTHNFGRDLSALRRVLPLSPAYIGLLGPKKRHWQLLHELHADPELNPEGFNSIHAPAGLDLGSESPEEIALSIVSEVSAVLSKRHGGHLRDRASPIHLVTPSASAFIA